MGSVALAAIAWATLGPHGAPASVPVQVPAVAVAAPPLAGPASASVPPVIAAGIAVPEQILAPSPAPASTPVAEMPASVPAVPAAKAPVAAKEVKDAKPASKETAKERRAREARERETRIVASPPAAVATGLVRIAISPWGEVEVDGRAAGTSPPLTELNLPAGRHQIVVRNTDLPAYSTSVNVTADQPVTLKHKF